MNLFRQHPATHQLHRQRSAGRVRRALASFRSPRRAALSIFALVLSVIWIGQAVAGVFLREAADPVRLFRWVTLGLTGFALWNLIKITFRKPVEPFEWSEAEKEWLCSSSLSREHLIRYRLAGVSDAALFKAGIFVLVMIPDLHFLLAGFVGLYIGLMLIEILRMTMEIIDAGMTSKQRVLLQIVAGAIVLVSLTGAGIWFTSQWNAGRFSEIISLPFLQCVQDGLQVLPETAIGKIIGAPFGVVASMMLTDSLDWTFAGKLLVCMLSLPILIRGLVIVDRKMVQLRDQHEIENWKYARQLTKEKQARIKCRSRKAPSGGGVGALIWRQFQGVRGYRCSVLFSLFVPMLFALGPAYGKQTGWAMVQALILMLGFWSFFLLPAALKFDFRRDLNRVNVLKALPLDTWKITVAQLVVPVVLTSLFQLATLLAALVINPYSPWYLLSALMILLPFNVFIYAVENTAFLLYPYRVAEEGIQIFIRTILAFTAKGFLLGVVAATGLLLFLASVLVSNYLPSPRSTSLILFSVLSLVIGSLVSSAFVWLLARTFGRIDPSHDLATVQA